MYFTSSVLKLLILSTPISKNAISALDLVKEGYEWTKNPYTTLPIATNWEYVYNLTDTDKCPSSPETKCTCLLYRDECNYPGTIALIDDLQRYVLYNETSVIVCNQVQASMLCCDVNDEATCDDSNTTYEYYGNTYVFTVEEKAGGVAALFDIMDGTNDSKCDFCMDRNANNTLVLLESSSYSKEECDLGYGWLRVANASNLEEVTCESPPLIEPIVPARIINSTIVEISGGLDSVGSTLSDVDAGQVGEEISAIKVGYRLSLTHEDSDYLMVGGQGYVAYTQECDNGCCVIKYKDACDQYPGIKINSRSSDHITAIVNETNVIMCGKTSTWDACASSDSFRYFGSTKYYDLIQEDDSISVLSGIESDESCNDICLNENGDVIISYNDEIDSNTCVIGSGWLKVKNYTLNKCSTEVYGGITDNGSISANQTSITAALLEQEAAAAAGYTSGTPQNTSVFSEIRRGNASSVRSDDDFFDDDVLSQVTSSPFPTYSPITTEQNEVPAASYSSPSSSTVDTPNAASTRMNTNIILSLVLTSTISCFLLM